MELIFRGYEAGDFESMFRLDELCFDPRFRFSRRAMKRFAELKGARVVLAHAGEELAGFCIVHEDASAQERVGYVVTLDVAEAWRRKGVAGLLMSKIESLISDAGCVAMVLHVYRGNVAAIRFYERLGYAEHGVCDGFYGVSMDGLMYRKELRTACSHYETD